MSNYRSIGQVAFHKPLAKCGMEELAARQRAIQPSGGVVFARKEDGERKTTARQLVIDLFHPNRWPHRFDADHHVAENAVHQTHCAGYRPRRWAFAMAASLPRRRSAARYRVF